MGSGGGPDVADVQIDTCCSEVFRDVVASGLGYDPFHHNPHGRIPCDRSVGVLHRAFTLLAGVGPRGGGSACITTAKDHRADM